MHFRPVITPALELEGLQAYQGRREENCQVQHAFRRRRKVAEVLQRKKLQTLETSGEMDNMFILLCDGIMGSDVIAWHPQWMNKLLASMAHAFTLAAYAEETDIDNLLPRHRRQCNTIIPIYCAVADRTEDLS